MIFQGSKRYPVQDIVLHCTATDPDFMLGNTSLARVAEVRRWHTDPKPKGRGWDDIGYHWLVDRDGTVLPGRAETTIGAGVMGFNNGVIHISMFGGKDSSENDKFSSNFTEAQAAAVLKLIASIKLRTDIKRISGHNEHAAKACPGFRVPAWLKEAE